VDGRIVALTYLGAQTEVSVELPGGQRVLGLVAEPAPTPARRRRTCIPDAPARRVHRAEM